MLNKGGGGVRGAKDKEKRSLHKSKEQRKKWEGLVTCGFCIAMEGEGQCNVYTFLRKTAPVD